MKKLIDQIMKFGIVGALAFVIDYGVYTLLANVVQIDYLVANIFGFILSLIFNYFMSMKFVFERKEDADKKKEFITFAILSVIGLGLNELIIYGCVDGIYLNSMALQEQFGLGLAKQAGKIIATGIVMVYNFISRKIFIEGNNTKRSSNASQNEA